VTVAFYNWARNLEFRAATLHRPESVDALRELVATLPLLRALGTGHSFNDIADTTGDLVSVSALPPVMDIDTAANTVTVSAGTRYGELAPYLHRAGYALHNLGSLPHISIAGACATGTHGSGVRNGNLATAVTAMQLVRPDGELVNLSTVDNCAVHLGALGVVTALTLRIEDSYAVAQYVFDDLPRAALQEHLGEILGAAYSVSLFTDWRGPRINQVWLKCRGDEKPGELYGATPADAPRHPVPGMSAQYCTEQLGVPGAWYERLPHFKLEFTPSAGEELQSEYFVAATDALAAFAALDGIADRIAAALQISEIRTIAADELWLSPAYGRDSVAFHFTWVKDPEAVAPVLSAIEAALEPFGARPHWGKLFRTDPTVLRGLYERWPDFVALRSAYDPTGKLRNDFLDAYL
jgi:xylitol oxidase